MAEVLPRALLCDLVGCYPLSLVRARDILDSGLPFWPTNRLTPVDDLDSDLLNRLRTDLEIRVLEGVTAAPQP